MSGENPKRPEEEPELPREEPDPASNVGPVVSHGVDVVAIDRIGDLLSEFGDSFRDRVFTPAEQAYCEAQGDPSQHYAARWAAKEAFLKTLRKSSPGVPTAAIEVDRRADGPRLSLDPVASDALDAMLAKRDVSPETVDIDVSLSHDQTAGYAIGSVTIVGTAKRDD
ncbi:holo-ACP synthase (plasmid) [Haloferax mediterranei ATCC 33500]|uniref:4-phosphopantetheinyl transferase n=1 Tax=Haloferax mediterranei (strain ATCC 33500 / DSM 1411 / JCM 8866 / NBRC 14739 / NCIMB 2177 / R-4) TaxID=523841 RepID=I3RBD1_HALMT|nr:holo-ACP synthase [Haloferax mediterranei]AFK21541.1 phosphopantetheine--protein transferase [Haloferax mediterranei ATCC 33500]AHZ24408.1 4-phosphopantetheinyl transferase [Haloferax mediterranei ATCC 33500]ELZ97149.1 phosphopantetheine--protein transferase [Haloferax mediterranei ATCC 33500]MDX5990108.1 holo-ACP synthase [Haloferax mediterranei ATCC 33500]QCQ76807.1 holo-ACP synthase [Haloferax mediterranei ATCC 33500]